MKRTVKLLAALLSLLVLGTTLSVPVTAVEPDDSVSPFLLEATHPFYSESFELYDSEDGFLALLGSAVAYYNDRNKTLSVNTDAYAFDDVTEEQYKRFGASSEARILHYDMDLDHVASDVLYSSYLSDYLLASVYETIDPEIYRFSIISSLYWGNSGNVDGCSGHYTVGEDFTY